MQRSAAAEHASGGHRARAPAARTATARGWTRPARTGPALPPSASPRRAAAPPLRARPAPRRSWRPCGRPWRSPTRRPGGPQSLAAHHRCDPRLGRSMPLAITVPTRTQRSEDAQRHGQRRRRRRRASLDSRYPLCAARQSHQSPVQQAEPHLKLSRRLRIPVGCLSPRPPDRVSKRRLQARCSLNGASHRLRPSTGRSWLLDNEAQGQALDAKPAATAACCTTRDCTAAAMCTQAWSQ